MNIISLIFGSRKKNRRTLLQEPPAIAQTMDAGRIADILRLAEGGDMRDFFALARDIVAGHGHTQTEFGKRKLAVLAETQNFPPADPEDPRQVALAKAVAKHLDSLPSWYQGMLHLLDSTIYPVSVLQKVYKPSARPGWRFELESLIPVQYDLLDFSTGCLRIRDVGPDGYLTGTTHEPSPLRYVIHRGHLLTSCPDTWGGPMRAILFWWLFATQNRDWWARFLERFGGPFLEGTYAKGDDDSRMALERAFSAATRLFGIAVPDDASVKIHQANATQGGDAFEKFHGTANREISKIVVGQTLSAEGANLGLGGGQASVQDGVRGDIRQFDAIMLAFTVRTQILAPLCEINGWSIDTPRVAWGGDDVEDLNTLSQVLERLANTGTHLTDDGIDALSKRMGLPLHRPAGSAPVIGGLSAMSAPDPLRRLISNSISANQSVDRIASVGSDPFLSAMGKSLAPLSALVGESTSLADLEARLLKAIPTLDVAAAARVAESALVSSSANAALGFRDV